MNHEDHDGHEGRDANSSDNFHMRLPSPLTRAAERITTQIIGCAIQVHRELGPGFLESIYVAALCLELTSQQLPFERERAIFVNYRGTPIPGQRVDLIVADVVVVEIKAVSCMEAIFDAQLLSYLRTTGIRAGFLINFNSVLLKDGLKRFVL
jgi:GxxExxY protein